VFKTLAT